MKNYKIEKISKNDIQDVYNYLNKKVEDPELMQDINICVSCDELAYKMVINCEIVAVMLAKRFHNHYKIWYYFVNEKQRKNMPSLFFFLFCKDKMKEFSIYIKAYKNLQDYERYFKHIEDDMYKFKGLR